MTKIVTNADGSIDITLPPRVDHVEVFALPSIPVALLLAALVMTWAILIYKKWNRHSK
jgi:hypothetical protein